jgi:5,10-methenyltetrahydrofolate synthetase
MDAVDYRNAPEAEAAAEEVNTMPLATDASWQQELTTGAADPSAERKRELRAQFRARRDALPERERQAADRRIHERLLAHPDLQRAGSVLLYAHHGSEVATDELAKALLKLGKIVVYPKLTEVPGLMTLWRVRQLDALVPHRLGIRAPDVSRASPVEPADIDCVLYPGLAFTKSLVRLGQGGGYYDRLSARLPRHSVRIGLAYECQLADELPLAPHDAPMHWVVTEAAVYP